MSLRIGSVRNSPAVSNVAANFNAAFDGGYTVSDIEKVLEKYAALYPPQTRGSGSRVSPPALDALAAENPAWDLSRYGIKASDYDQNIKDLATEIFYAINKSSLKFNDPSSPNATLGFNEGKGVKNYGFEKDSVLDASEIKSTGVVKNGKTYYLFSDDNAEKPAAPVKPTYTDKKPPSKTSPNFFDSSIEKKGTNKSIGEARSGPIKP